jgi:hypothetical protein
MAEGTIVDSLVPCAEMGCTSSKDVDCRETAYADVTSYGQGYDRRDVVSKTQIRKSNITRDVRVANVLESDCDVRMQSIIVVTNAGGQLQL